MHRFMALSTRYPGQMRSTPTLSTDDRITCIRVLVADCVSSNELTLGAALIFFDAGTMPD